MISMGARMAQNISHLVQYLVAESDRNKAEIKYQLKQLENRLNRYLDTQSELDVFPSEVSALSDALAHKYLEYLELIDTNQDYDFYELPRSVNSLPWQEQYYLILDLKEKLYKTTNFKEECELLHEIASLHYHFKGSIRLSGSPAKINDEQLVYLNKIFRTNDLYSWLIALIEFRNESDEENIELSSLIYDWSLEQIQHALDFFSAEELINLANAIFFYKLYPDKLFDELIHPEKLVSVRMRLALLHHSIELLECQLYSAAQQHGLKTEVDYLFHGDELPQGIMIDVDEEYKEIIQSAIKQLKVKHSPESESQDTLDRLHDLGRAYKFWFNPNRLIDAVMVLQQRLVKDDVPDEYKLVAFQQQMVYLYEQLSTTECLDLYGYFANKDSRYLLYTLFTIDQNKDL